MKLDLEKKNEEFLLIQYRIIMSADGLISEFKRLLSAKCGLSVNKVR